MDYRDIAGAEVAKRALVLACAGGHGVILAGSEGAPVTELVEALPTIMGDVTAEEASAADEAVRRARGICDGLAELLAHEPPPAERAKLERELERRTAAFDELDRAMYSFMAGLRPITTVPASAPLGDVLGGGRPPVPGAVTWAHGGVLHLKDAQDMGKMYLESIKTCAVDNEVRLVRADGVYTFPSRFMTVASCGQDREGVRHVLRSLADVCPIACAVDRDGFDLSGRMDSDTMRDQVMAGRELAGWRQAHGVQTDCRAIFEALPTHAERLLEHHAERLGLSGDDVRRAATVARTAADVAGREEIGENDIVEGLGFVPRVTTLCHPERGPERVDEVQLPAREAGLPEEER